ncbi:MAG: nucleotidyltransferase domain-containing protein [Proteobacteria bacterium]|nr:nucleotidyltransferase domain-containing protein [Pseudomonadota bacterium]
MKIFSALSREKVLDEIEVWVCEIKKDNPEIVKIGLFGSYAKDTYVPGSDIDLLVWVTHSDEDRWFMRSSRYDASSLPIGADVIVYTEEEARRLEKDSLWFQSILKDIIWISPDCRIRKP